MRFYGRDKQASSSPEGYGYGDDKTHHYPGPVGYGDELPPAEENYDADLHVRCPAHTTERRLLTRIDLHVIPFLCILYRELPVDGVRMGQLANESSKSWPSLTG